MYTITLLQNVFTDFYIFLEFDSLMTLLDMGRSREEGRGRGRGGGRGSEPPWKIQLL